MPQHRVGVTRSRYSGGVVSNGQSIAGLVSDLSSNPVAGGEVWVYNQALTQKLYTATIAGDGTYSVALSAAGTYGVMLQPKPPLWSLGPSEQSIRTVTVSAGQTNPQNFTVQPAVYGDDFQSYASSAALRSTFWVGTNRDLAFAPNTNVLLDTSGSPKEMRYDWAAKPWNGTDPLTNGGGTGYCQTETTNAIQPRLKDTALVGLDNLFVRWKGRVSPNFQHGSSSCLGATGLSYKWFLVGFDTSGRTSRFGSYLFNNGVSNVNTRLYLDLADRDAVGVNGAVISSDDDGGARDFGALAGMDGNNHVWNVEMLNLCTAACTWRVIQDGVLIESLTGPFLNGVTLGAGWAVTFEMGSNINNGPDAAQSRWWSEFSVATTRLSYA